MWAVARRPRWIAALALCLGIAAGFVLLSQWQVSRSITRATVEHRHTETVVPLASVAKPQDGVTTTADGQMVSTDGAFVAGDFEILSGRENFGKTGFWLVGHFIDNSARASGTNGASLAVALGWGATERAAASAIAPLESTHSIVHVVGRFLASEQPEDDDFEHGVHKSMAVSALINQWVDAPTGVYGGYVISRDAPAGLDAIASPPPVEDITLNWLNIFYAIEWVLFAGFAIYLWFRLVRDAWEREQDENAELH